MRLSAVALFFMIPAPRGPRLKRKSKTGARSRWTCRSYTEPPLLSLPAKHFDLTSHHGYLRYLVDPMTFADGFSTGMQPLPPNRGATSTTRASRFAAHLQATAGRSRPKPTTISPGATVAHSRNVYFGTVDPAPFTP